jgi:hypothetical protein
MHILRLFAVLAVALYLIPGGAHVLEMANKLAMPPTEYMVVQRIYAGWDRMGFVLFASLILTLSHAIFAWRAPTARWLSLGAFLVLATNLAVFYAYTYPTNVLTRNWTVTPDNFEAARRQWEYSHLANAGLVLLALILIMLGVLASSRASGMAAAQGRVAPG